MIKIYLAIPYSGMEESSFKQANEATVFLLNAGYNVFSPITHSHPLTRHNLPGTWDFWQEIDFQFLDWADELWVLSPLEGYNKLSSSKGVTAEIEYFTQKYPEKPVKIGTLKNWEKILYGQSLEI